MRTRQSEAGAVHSIIDARPQADRSINASRNAACYPAGVPNLTTAVEPSLSSSVDDGSCPTADPSTVSKFSLDRVENLPLSLVIAGRRPRRSASALNARHVCLLHDAEE